MLNKTQSLFHIWRCSWNWYY